MQDYYVGCRVCLLVQAKMKNIRSCGEKTLEKINAILSPSILNTENGSMNICCDCLSKVWDYDIFRSSLIANNKSVNTFFYKQSLINNFEESECSMAVVPSKPDTTFVELKSKKKSESLLKSAEKRKHENSNSDYESTVVEPKTVSSESKKKSKSQSTKSSEKRKHEHLSSDCDSKEYEKKPKVVDAESKKSEDDSKQKSKEKDEYVRKSKKNSSESEKNSKSSSDITSSSKKKERKIKHFKKPEHHIQIKGHESKSSRGDPKDIKMKEEHKRSEVHENNATFGKKSNSKRDANVTDENKPEIKERNDTETIEQSLQTEETKKATPELKVKRKRLVVKVKRLTKIKIDKINIDLTKKKIANLPKIPKKDKNLTTNSKTIEKTEKLAKNRFSKSLMEFEEFNKNIKAKQLAVSTNKSNNSLLLRTNSVMVTSTPSTINSRRSSIYEETKKYGNNKQSSQVQNRDPRTNNNQTSSISTVSKIRDILGIDETSFKPRNLNDKLISPSSPKKAPPRRKSIMITNPENKINLPLLKLGLPVLKPAPPEQSSTLKVLTPETLNKSFVETNQTENSTLSSNCTDLSHIFKNPVGIVAPNNNNLTSQVTKQRSLTVSISKKSKLSYLKIKDNDTGMIVDENDVSEFEKIYIRKTIKGENLQKLKDAMKGTCLHPDSKFVYDLLLNN
ncbi:hypothetical protein ACFFRR_009223 [Megaselia abdita]